MPKPPRNPDKPAVAEVHLLVPMDTKNAWVKSAQSEGLTLGEWAEKHLNQVTPERLKRR